MPTVKLSPLFNDQTETSTGIPASGYKIYTYTAGSSTPLATYTSSAGSVAQANPIILNANGWPDNPIWLQSGLTYKFVLKDANDVTITTIDNVSGINDTSTSVSQWASSGLTPTYVSATSFTVPGDQTTELHVGRRCQFTVTAGTVYGRILTSAYTTLTTVTMTMDAGQSLDSGLSVVNLSILRNDRSALPAIAAASGANSDITSLTGLTTSIADVRQIQPITASVATNALTLTINPTTLDFRSTTLANGTITTVKLANAVSLTVASGATLGTTNGIAARIALLAINNAGTIEPAVVNLAGGNNLDETGLISTTALSGSSNSASTIYSTTARSSVAFRVVGFIDITEATAGTWASSPTTIQGQGGQAMAAMQSLGYSQSWQNVTASRGLATTYYNTTGRPISVFAYLSTSAGNAMFSTVGGISNVAMSPASGYVSVTFIVPPNVSYSVSCTGASGLTWNELR